MSISVPCKQCHRMTIYYKSQSIDGCLKYFIPEFFFMSTIQAFFPLGQKKYMCVYCHMSKKSRVGRSVLIFFFFKLSAKPEIVIPGSGIRYFIFEISGKPSFVEVVLWRITQFFHLLCSQFRQKASGWINKTLLLIKQQKWLSEFCVKIDRVASKN